MTDIGMKRSVNQDYVFKSDQPMGSFDNLYIVADGMGGHQAGDLASKYAVEVICNQVKNELQGEPHYVFDKALREANEQVLRKASTDDNLKGMGTTVVAATVIDDILHFVNIGDSRLYVINQGINQLSRDHSLVEEMVRLGGIKPEEAKNHPDKNIITRAIGAKEKIQPDYYQYQIKKDDCFLMCSDGLTNMVDDATIFNLVQGARDIVEAVINLIEKAKQNGGADNIGVIVFKPMIDEVNLC